jgi:hypothetical protein
MSDQDEKLALSTCRDFLTMAQLKEICRYRGFNTTAKDKETRITFVANRLLESAGVAESMASLDENFLSILHLICMGSKPVAVRDLEKIFFPSAKHHDKDASRDVFNRLTHGLLNRGIVLVEDNSLGGYRYESRYARLVLRVPPSHQALLPPFPMDRQPMETPVTADPWAFFRSALLLAVRKEGASHSSKPEGLLDQLAAAISFDGGILTIDKTPAPTASQLLELIRSLWIKDARKKEDPYGSIDFRQAASCMLSRLPKGSGCVLESLRRGLARLAISPSESDLKLFCESGARAGLLSHSPGAAGGLYVAPALAESRLFETPLVFSPDAQGIQVDLDRSGIKAFLELSAFSHVVVKNGKLHHSPDLIRMGRAGSQLPDSAALKEVCAHSPAYRKAASHIEAHYGKAFLHEGLVILQVNDLGLRTQLQHAFASQLRLLEGAFMAVPRGLCAKVEAFARKAGFAPRRIS